jgi:hypothetical protein
LTQRGATTGRFSAPRRGPLVQRPYPRSMAELARWIMRDIDEESLDELFEALTEDDSK